MNILQIVPNRGWGGGEKYVWELASGLAADGHQVHTLLPPCDILAGRFAGMESSTLKFRGPYDLRAIKVLARIIRERQIGIVHTHIFKHAMAALVARRLYGLDVKIVMTRHLCRPGKRGMHYPWLYRRIDKIIFVSTAAQESFLSSRPPIDPAKLCVIHNSIRTTFRPTALTADNCLRVGFAGTLMPIKGIDFLLDTAVQIRQHGLPVQILVAGRGSEAYTAHIQARIAAENLGEIIKMVGFVDDVIGFFGTMDAVIVPSAAPESFSLATLEGMAAGRAVLFSRYIPDEIARDGVNGLLIDISDPTETALRLGELCADQELLARLGAAGRQIFETSFTYPRFLEKITALYRDL